MRRRDFVKRAATVVGAVAGLGTARVAGPWPVKAAREAQARVVAALDPAQAFLGVRYSRAVGNAPIPVLAAARWRRS